MDRAAELGKALAQLRGLQGISVEACASRLDTAVDAIAAAERGDIAPTALEGLARLYALDVEALREGTIMPAEAGETSTVFLLRGTYTEFDARDLGVLGRAMRAARSMTALAARGNDEEPLRQRLQFTPVAVAGPRPRDAARQGYKLARMVRAKLQLGSEPIGDLRALLEEKLGIAVLVDDLVSYDLRAASILDVHRAAAAAVLASNHPDLYGNPTLARVYLAHELGHLLFDPGVPTSIRLALDGPSTQGASRAELLESRAKGFAAEFLIPKEGLIALLGEPSTPEASLHDARAVVAKARDRFGTPWEIATRHLGNLGYIRGELILDLLVQPPSPTVPHVTTLPKRAAMPCRLESLLATSTAPEVSRAEVSGVVAEVARTPPWYVDDSRRATMAALDELTSRVLVSALDSISRGREIEAGDRLVEHLDDLFLAGEFEVAGRLLERLDPQKLPPKVLSGVLMVSSHARTELGAARLSLLDRARAALLGTWRVAPETVESFFRRIA